MLKMTSGNNPIPSNTRTNPPSKTDSFIPWGKKLEKILIVTLVLQSRETSIHPMISHIPPTLFFFSNPTNQPNQSPHPSIHIYYSKKTTQRQITHPTSEQPAVSPKLQSQSWPPQYPVRFRCQRRSSGPRRAGPGRHQPRSLRAHRPRRH